jgi:pyridoxal phosphate enzyme (YggS family)
MRERQSIAENLRLVREKMAQACVRAKRPVDSVRLVAVSKTKPVELIQEAMLAGQTIFGENYVQEAVDKINQVPSAEWHFIGTLQSNKAKQVAGSFALVHSVDRLKLAQAIDSAAAARGIVQPILLQVHIGDEATKYGFSILEMPDVLAQVGAFKNLSLRGLMALPPLEETEAGARANFAKLREALEKWRTILPAENHKEFCELSMGTSSDFESAILEGATLIRVGTTVFGVRK